MAVRSGAGTGVIVSLVVFVLTTVFLLVLAIVFYSGQNKALEEAAEAESRLARYVSRTEQSTDAFQSFEGQASQRNQSVARYLHNRYQSLMSMTTGNPEGDIASFQAQAQRFNISESNPAIRVLDNQSRQIQNLQSEIEEKNESLLERENRIAEMQARIEQLREDNEQRVAELRSELQDYIDAAERYQEDVATTKESMEDAITRLQDQYEGRINDLRQESDDMSVELEVMRSRVDELQKQLRQDRERRLDPTALVDAKVLDVTGDEIFIDRGKKDRLELGMTFEVYDDTRAIRVNEQTGELSRGKASVQVVEVGDRTAKAKVTRSSRGRPVVRDDVLANVVYDPNYRQKFLVHGMFDLDGDGRPSHGDTEFIKGLVMDWGGTIVEGDQLPGDLDYLVLGVPPAEPGPMPADPTAQQLRDRIERREAIEIYNRLFRQAREAQIPVLNSNRFLTLIGFTGQ